jgi:hypothetical protein
MQFPDFLVIQTGSSEWVLCVPPQWRRSLSPDDAELDGGPDTGNPRAEFSAADSSTGGEPDARHRVVAAAVFTVAVWSARVRWARRRVRVNGLGR